MRGWALIGAIPSGFEKDIEAALTLSYSLEHELWTILWLVWLGGGFALWIGVACFLILYNLITIQIGWLLAVLFGGDGD